MKRKRDSLDMSDDVSEGTEAVFTAVEFRVMIRDHTTGFAALEKFLAQADKYPAKTSDDIVSSYCQTSGECEEIFKLLEAGRRKPPELCLIFRALECILLRVADDLTQFKIVSQNIVHRLLGSHLGVMYFMLSPGLKSNQIKASLKLLVAMVMQGESAAKEVQSQFNFTHRNLSQLINRRDTKDPKDVRMCMLHLMMSFLISGNDKVIKQLVETKGFLIMLFPGLKVDKFTALQLVLMTLKDKVVQNPAVSKTAKLRLFGEQSLRSLACLYRWKGESVKPSANTEEEAMEVDFDETSLTEEQQAVQEMVHSLLLELCCSFKNGINFFDKSFGTSGKNQNLILTKFLSHLPKPHQSSLTRDLVSKVLVACPDQLHWYLPSIKHLLVPRPSRTYLQCCQFLSQIYQLQTEVSPALKLSDSSQASKVVPIIMATLIPPKEIWSNVLAAVRSKNRAIRHAGLDMLLVFLKRIGATLQQSRDKFTEQDVVLLLQQALTKVLPDSNQLINCWTQTVSSKPSSDADDGGSDTELADTPTDFPETLKTDHQLLILRVLCSYQSALPGLFQDRPLDFSPFLEGVRVKEDDSKLLPLLQLHVLKLLAGTDSRQIPWLKKSAGKHSTLYLLLEMLITTSKTSLADTTSQLLKQLLAGTGLFPAAETELDIWLHLLTECRSSDQEAVVTFLEKVITSIMHNPHTYADRILELMSESTTARTETETRDQDMETGSLTTNSALIDSILSMDEVSLMEEEQSNVQPETSRGDCSVRLSFSSLVPASLELIKTDEDCEAKVSYLTKVLQTVLVTQEDPAALCVLLHHHHPNMMENKELKTSVERFLPSSTKARKSPRKSPKKKCVQKLQLGDSANVCDFLRSCFESGQEANVDEKQRKALLDGALNVSARDREKLVRQTLLYLKTLEDEFEQKSLDAKKSIALYINILKNIIQGILESSQNKMDADSAETGNDTFSSLVPETSPKEVLKNVYSLILNHAALRNVFLLPVEYASSGDQLRKKGETLIEVLTPHITELLELIPEDYAIDVKALLNVYITPLEMEISRVFSQTKTSSTSICKDDVTSLSGRLKVFIDYVSPETLRKLCEILLADRLEHTQDLGLKVMHLLCQEENKQILVEAGLSHSSVGKFFQLVIQSDNLDAVHVAANLLEIAPCYAACVERVVFHHCLNAGSTHLVALAVQCMAHNAVCCLWFQQWCKMALKAKTKKVKVEHLPAVRQYMISGAIESSDSRAVVAALKKVFMPTLKQWLMQKLHSDDTSEESSQLYQDIFVLFVRNTFEAGELDEAFNDLSSRLIQQTKPTTKHHIDILTVVAEQMCRADDDNDDDDDDDDDNSVTVRGLISSLLAAFISVVKQKITKQNKPELLVLQTHILGHILDWLCRTSDKMEELAMIVAPVYTDLIKYGLRQCIANAKFLAVLRQLVPAVYKDGDLSDLPLAMLYQMILSHSQFTEVMFGNEDLKAKESLVDLLLTIAELDPTCCQTAHVALLLGAYGATLSVTDQKLLLLLHHYETSGCNMTEYQPYMWGLKAVEHHNLKKNLGPSLWKQPSTEEVIALLDKEALQKSILRFPLKRSLKLQSVTEAEELNSAADVYDPCFLLPVFSHLLSPASFVNCAKFIEHGCLGYVFSTLSSHDSGLRAVGYHLLVAFQLHVEGAKFREKAQIGYLLEFLKNTIEEPGYRLPCVISAFLAKAAQMLLKPEDHMYQMVNSFLLLKPSLDISNIPDFYKLFNTSALEFKVERSWMLSLMLDGLREKADYDIYQRRQAFKLLLAFGSSAFSDQRSQCQVLEVLNRACSIKEAAADLVKRYGILAWIDGLIMGSLTDQSSSLLVKMLNSLWFTMLRNYEEKPLDPQKKKPHAFTLLFVNEMLLCLLCLLRKTRSFLTVGTMSSYTSCLLSVLTQQGNICDSEGSRSASNLSQVKLMATDILLLLQAYRNFEGKQNSVLTDPDGRASGKESRGIRKKHEDVVLDKDNQGGHQSTGKKLVSVCTDLLQVACFWHPGQTADAQAAIRILKWVTENLLVTLDFDQEMLAKILQWIKSELIPIKGLVSRVFSEIENDSRLTSQLFSLYGRIEAKYRSIGLTHGQDITVKATLLEVRQTLNELYQTLFDCVQVEKIEQSKLLATLSSKPYSEAFARLRKEKLQTSAMVEAESLLIKEAWLGATSPNHFIEFLRLKI